jgi:hypothetical protein
MATIGFVSRFDFWPGKTHCPAVNDRSWRGGFGTGALQVIFAYRVLAAATPAARRASFVAYLHQPFVRVYRSLLGHGSKLKPVMSKYSN